MVYRYTDTLLAQAIQIAVCSRFHVLEARLARSLLITRDRLRFGQIPPHPRVPRACAGRAPRRRDQGGQRAAAQGLINYSRGNIEILDPVGLAAVSCQCYEIVKEAEDNPPPALFA